MPPKVLQKNPNRGGGGGGGGDGAGVLPIPASVRAPPAPKPPAARLKLEIRRLPPGLTLSEFEETLGEEWKLGKGRVDWREYRQGKAKNVSKMPELSRCYVHVVKEEWVGEFEKRFLAVTFRDKAGTWKSAAGGAPMLGFAMNQRVPLQQGKQRARADNRQGTIDQDAEYMAFLEAETQPIPKASAIDSANNAEKKDDDAGAKGKVKSTPLIEDLRERKANKAKAAASKAEKADRKGKGDSKGEESSPAATSGGKKGDKGKVEQAAKEVAKAANKQAAGKQSQNNNAATNANANNASQKAAQTPAKGRRGAAQQNAKATAAAAAAQPQTQQQTTPAGPAAQRGPAQRQRGNNAEGIKKMLQKDLGIKPKSAAADQPAQTGNAAAAARNQANNNNNNNNQQTPAQPKTPAQTPKQQQQQQSSNSGPPKAYLKHANPSQGMTEILIQQALAQFGEMNNVTIDPRKGTAIAVFKTQEGLKKAVQAKKVPVAKGAVEVIEFKDRGGGGGGGGSGNNSNSNSNSNGNNNSNSNSGNNNSSGGGGGGGGGRGGFRNRGGRAGRGGNNNSGAANANATKSGGSGNGQAAAAG